MFWNILRLNEKIIEHAGKDNRSHMLKHTLQSGHPLVSPNDFRILLNTSKDIGSPTHQKTPTLVKHTWKFGTFRTL